MKKILIKKEEKGFVILFTVVIVGIITAITIGISNSAYKQIILSAVALDSTTAFYQSDIAVECALYIDNLNNMISLPTGITECSSETLGPISTISSAGTTTHTINPLILGQDGSCFYITVEKTETDTAIRTKVMTRGYNICDLLNLRTVERSVEVNY